MLKLDNMLILEVLAMPELNVTATEFQNRAGQYLDEAARSPVFVTRHGRPSRVLLDIVEYERLKRGDTRQAIRPEDLTDEEITALEESRMDPRHDHLNALLD